MPLLYKTLVAMRFPPKITSRVAFGSPYLLIELFYIGMPVVRTDGRAYSHVINKFFGWVNHHIFLPMVLRCARETSAIRKGYHNCTIYNMYVLLFLLTTQFPFMNSWCIEGSDASREAIAARYSGIMGE